MFNNRLKLRHFFYLLIIKISCCEFSNNAKQIFFTNTTAMNFFRFRDFEPRYAIKSELFRATESKRKPRGFQFNTNDHDFNVDLEFIVPFIHIPIERSMTTAQTALRSLLNLNVQSIFTTGAIVAIGAVFAIALKIVFAQYALINGYGKSYRSNDFIHQNAHVYNQTYDNESDSEYSFNNFATLVETKLQENGFNIGQCIQNSLCNYAQECFYKANGPCGDGLPRILSGVSSLDFIQNYLRGSSIQTALDAAKNSDNCSKVFSNCNWPFSPNVVLKFLTQYINLLI